LHIRQQWSRWRANNRLGRELERLSKPLLEGVEAEEATAEGEEGLMDVGTPFMANGEAT
jgi:uncharacterized protein YjiS (DUF1127 family)